MCSFSPKWMRCFFALNYQTYSRKDMQCHFVDCVIPSRGPSLFLLLNFPHNYRVKTWNQKLEYKSKNFFLSFTFYSYIFRYISAFCLYFELDYAFFSSVVSFKIKRYAVSFHIRVRNTLRTSRVSAMLSSSIRFILCYFCYFGSHLYSMSIIILQKTLH